jgi:hypothetical protein
MKTKLKKIAKLIRQEIEELRENKAPKFTTTETLAGLCYYASIMLYYKLKKENLSPLIVEGRGHWFVSCEGYTIDITASQFGEKKIIVEKENLIKNRINKYWWNEVRRGTVQSIFGINFLVYAKRDIEAAREYIKGKMK